MLMLMTSLYFDKQLENADDTTIRISHLRRTTGSANACKLTYNPHDPSVAYWTTRNNTNAFKWPDSKALKDDFPDTAEGQKVVLALLPNFIPYGFGAVPQEGPIKEMGDVFAQMDNGPDQGVDLKPIHDAVLVLVKNGKSRKISSRREQISM